MDIQAYEQELLDNIEELENEIETLKQELIEQPEYEEDIISDIQRCYEEINEIQEQLEEKEYLNWESDKEGEEREWENSRL